MVKDWFFAENTLKASCSAAIKKQDNPWKRKTLSAAMPLWAYVYRLFFINANVKNKISDMQENFIKKSQFIILKTGPDGVIFYPLTDGCFSDSVQKGKLYFSVLIFLVMDEEL